MTAQSKVAVEEALRIGKSEEFLRRAIVRLFQPGAHDAYIRKEVQDDPKPGQILYFVQEIVE